MADEPMHVWRPRRNPWTIAHRQNGSSATRQKYKGKPELPPLKIDLEKIKELLK